LSGRDANLGPRASRPLAPAAAHRGWHARGYLPHFDSPETVQTVAFRLFDSLPRSVYDEITALPIAGKRRQRLDALLDEGRGACVLREPKNAEIVENALVHFDGERYRLLAWVVMPNHVHAMVEQVEGYRLSDIVHSWKSYTAKAINGVRKRSGSLWAPDYFDRFVRDERHYAAALHYIEGNPVKAGLAARAQEWPFSSATRR
jgi:putative transposase